MAEPVIGPGDAGVPGATVTARLPGALIPQEFPAVTLIFPFSPADPVLTVTEVEFCPAVMDHPVGTDQLYVVASGTAAMLYVWPVKPGHWEIVPDIAPGWAGIPGETVTARLLAALVPHEFPAVTLTFPFWPAGPVVTVIAFVFCPPVMDHPEGTLQV